MKRSIIFYGFLIAMLTLSINVNAQGSATANISANIVTPISITKTADLSFGNIAVSASTGGTVLLGTAGSRTATGGVTLPATGGSPTAASFSVIGSNNYTYAITLPASVTIVNGSNSMTINGFTSSPTTTGTLISGSQTLNIGATLNIPPGQATGTYVSTPFNVIVNYN